MPISAVHQKYIKIVIMNSKQRLLTLRLEEADTTLLSKDWKYDDPLTQQNSK